MRHCPALTDGQISKLIGTTKPTIVAIRERTHWNMANIKPREPVGLGLCSRADLDAALEKAGYVPEPPLEDSDAFPVEQLARTEPDPPDPDPQLG